MIPAWQQAFRIGSQTFTALMEEAMRCACDQHGVPLCVRCECLFRLAVAATDYAYVVRRQQGGRARLTEADLLWAHQAVTRQGWRGPKETP
jgi:hypothetical protein